MGGGGGGGGGGETRCIVVYVKMVNGQKRFEYITCGWALLWREKKSPYVWTRSEGHVRHGKTWQINGRDYHLWWAFICDQVRKEKQNKTVDKSSVNIHLTSLSDKLFIYKSLSFKAENITSHTTCGVWGIVVTLMIISVSKADLKKRIDTVKP